MWIDGRFWYPRFPTLRHLVPDRVLLAWPSFAIDGEWLDAAEIFGPLDEMARSSAGFRNDGETLFDAIGTTALDWHGCLGGMAGATCDLSGQVLVDLGYFDDRDALFVANGQTLGRTARIVGEPLVRRRRVG